MTAPLLLAVVLVVSAVGKLRAPERSRAAFTAMGVPAWLDRPWVSKAHPWAEIALAALLLVASGPLGVVVAAAALLLMLVYVALVVRALRRPVDVDCACFGSIGGERVTVGTVWRNLWLTALAVVTVTCAVEGPSVVSRVGALDAAGGWWLVSVLAAAVTAGLVLGTGGHGHANTAETAAPEVEEYLDDDGDYLRSRTPAVPVLLGDGTTTDLRTLSAERAQLLLFVSEGCGSCVPVIEAVPEWREQLPQLDIRFVLQVDREVSRLTSAAEPRSLHDLEGLVRDSFDTRATPSAMLLGADGLLAGGPVVGSTAVPDLVAEIKEQLGT